MLAVDVLQIAIEPRASAREARCRGKKTRNYELLLVLDERRRRVDDLLLNRRVLQRTGSRRVGKRP